MVDISQTNPKSGHDDTKSVFKIDDTPSDKGEAIPTKIKTPEEGSEPPFTSSN